MFKRFTWLTCAVLLCALLISLPAGQVAVASEPAVARIGDKTYPTLAAAVDAVPKDTPTTITLLADTTGSGVRVGKRTIKEDGKDKDIDWPMNITFDLAGHTYTVVNPTVGSTGTETNGFQLLKGSTVTFENGKITSSVAKILIQNYCNLTLENVVLDGTNLADTTPYTLSLNNGKVNITGNTSILAKKGGVAFDLYYWPKNGYTDGVQLTVNTTGTISGTIELTTDGSSSGQPENAAEHNKLNILNINHEGSIRNVLGSYDTDVVSIRGGTFAYTPVRYTKDTVVSSGNDFYVGAQANAVLGNSNTKEATVLQANGELTVADGIKLTNKTGGAITVNGNSLNNNGTIVIHTASTPPKTGDSADPLLWSMLLLAAFGAALLCMKLRKRFC